ncbi:glycoside hydrolase family 16 protein [Pseudarthrobacter sp. alpha12b]
MSGTDPGVGPALSDSTGGAGAEQPAVTGAADSPAAQPSGTEESSKPDDSPADGSANEASVKGTPVVASKETGPLGPPGQWQLVLDEEFNSLNTALWTPYWFRDCHPGSTKNGVKTCSSNVKVENGNAVLQLSDSESGALLSTNPKDGVKGHVGFQYTTGYVEARIYFPGTCSGGIYNWPAWWTTGQKFPSSGEVDIAEPLAGNMTTVYHSSGGDSGKGILGCWAGGYHTYGVHRKAGVNDIYYDGRRVSSYSTQDGNAPHYLILNVGLNPDQRTFGGAGAIKVDWVRAWQ